MTREKIIKRLMEIFAETEVAVTNFDMFAYSVTEEDIEITFRVRLWSKDGW
jgi:hypothetical protein